MSNEKRALMLSVVSGYCAYHDIKCKVDYDGFYNRWMFRGDDEEFSITNKGVVKKDWCPISTEEVNEYYYSERIAKVNRYLREYQDKIIGVLNE